MELCIRNLSKTYPSGVRALRDINLTIPNGMFGLLGPNGAGKSSLMRTIATLQEPDTGSITLGDLNVLTEKDRVRQVLGYLPQEFGLYPGILAEVLLDYFAGLKGIRDKGERKAAVESLLQQTNLWGARKKAVGGCSGGMRQRFGIAVGALLDMLAPWVDATKLGSVSGLVLLAPLLAAQWVNALFAGSVFFAAYLLFRSPLVVYLGGIVLFIGYQLSLQFSSRVTSDYLFAMLDPFGLIAKRLDTKYWTLAERNTQVAHYLGVFDWASISPEDRLTANGTFLDPSSLRTGYQPGGELGEEEGRRRQGLPAKQRVPRLNDRHGLNRSQFTRDADRIRFQATLSTDPDQLAFTAGYLQKNWVQGGRHDSRFRMDMPMMAAVSMLSARYQIYKTQWQSPAGGARVAIEIYCDPHHARNVPRMAQALRDGLAYYSKAFGPYQYRQIRLLEFPRYKSFAQSYANTIQTSESAGFIDNLHGKNSPDLTYFITNHELGHQWWGHQEVGADVQGASMLVESLAEYSAIMTAKHAFSPNQMQQFMRRELTNYLSGRRAERQKELPLLLCEDQPYIHYNKGGMVFYALQDYIGEDRLNGALKAFLADHHESRPPYATSADLLGYLRRATPDSL